MLTVSYCS